MSFFDRIAAVRTWDPDAFRPFVVDGHRVGRVRHATARALADFPDVFRVDAAAVTLSPRLADVDARSRAVHDVAETLAARGDAPTPRGEAYGVSETWATPARLRLDRGVVPLFGVKSYGVHLNGFVRRPDGLAIWVGTRAADKRVAPGKLDHLVAGGMAHGDSAHDTVVREADEEAAMPAELARQATPVGALSYVCEAESGLRDDTLFIYDLDVPADFTPACRDGEIVRFELMDVADALARVRDSDAFKFNVSVVMIDFFIRHGVVTPDEEPQYPELLQALHGAA
ncbi:NUDIX domain-containing protein [Limimonas halophila]|uniref:NUDIX domain-containing protein n=1 Tax=Limimonas halophila TaxID=1082479 RepID=A0A1G7TT39_9PROT|nr:DUF4743 domain-containing protein [Limimonas halophila]SDG38437.1 NUDIX domain-containing protein [Limimonas halophila]